MMEKEKIMNTDKNPFMPDHEIPIGPIGPNPYVPGKIMIKPVEFVNTKMVFSETLGMMVAVPDMDNPFIPPNSEVK